MFIYLTCYILVDCVWDDPGTPLLDSYDKWREWADSKVACDYALAVGVTSWADGKVGDDMSKLVSEKGSLYIDVHVYLILMNICGYY